jgi:lipopolysaccharide/colanic/teichoic acid biosynthesis glycosyltransferase
LARLPASDRCSARVREPQHEPGRGFDIACALVAGLACAPLYLTAVAFILADDGAPVLFRQARLGRARRPFTILKLRTMRDGRVTRVGRWLRASGIDETPQLWNVLRGDMRMVGPRPFTADDVARLGVDRGPAASRFQHAPGITGLAQLWSERGARHSRRLDALWGRRRNWTGDLQILIASFLVNVVGKRRARRWRRALASRLCAVRRRAACLEGLV